MAVELGGQVKSGFEFVTTRELGEVEDGRIDVIGPEIDEVEEGAQLPLGVWIEVAGREMNPDFEPILERQIHDLTNQARACFTWGSGISIGSDSKEAKAKAFDSSI